MERASRIALIGCGASKAPVTSAARELYRSQLFRASLRWALMHCDRAFVLSAKHGLLDLDTLVEPYDQALPRDRAGREAWGSRVGAQIVAAVGEVEATLVCLAGEKYADAISFDSPEWEYGWEEPLRGLEIGQRLSWFKRQSVFADDGEQEAA